MGVLYLDSFDHRGLGGSHPTIVSVGRHGQGATGTLTQAYDAQGSNRFVAGLWCINGATISALDYTGQFGIGGLSMYGDGSFGWGVLNISSTTFRSVGDLWRPNVGHYVEVDVKFGAEDDGWVKVWLDDPEHLYPVIDEEDVTTIDTIYANGGDIIEDYYGGVRVQSNGIFDDLYAGNGAAVDPFGNATLVGPVGPLEVIAVRPLAPGDKAEWTPIPAGDNVDNIDDADPDGDTTYNVATDTEIGAEDLHEMEAVSTGDQVFALHVWVAARTVGDGAGRIAGLLKHDGVVYDVAAQLLTNTYGHDSFMSLSAMPNGDPLSDANLTAQQLGYRREV